MNEHSSRSHHVFQIKIMGENNRFEHFESLLNIIDLAGSERRSNMQLNHLEKSKTLVSKQNISFH